jgi:NDP-sugar pyrophosphorylase family protein
MKKRYSLSLDSDLVKKVDSYIDGILIRSRSDAIEKILKEYVLLKKTAVILAGGKPDKLFIKELDEYRPLVKIGKRRLIEDIILKCREAGFRNIIIVGFSSLISKIYELLGDGKKYDINITYVEENKELSSAKTLELAKKYVGDDILFLPCDHYFDFDLKKLYEFHLRQNGIVTLGIHARTSFDWNTSIVVMDGYKIIDYEERPKIPKTHLISIFIGFMKKDIFDFIPPGDVYWSLQEHLFPRLAKENKLVGYPISGNWVNVHTKKDVEKINQLIKEQD